MRKIKTFLALSIISQNINIVNILNSAIIPFKYYFYFLKRKTIQNLSLFLSVICISVAYLRLLSKIKSLLKIKSNKTNSKNELLFLMQNSPCLKAID